jgi:hypothetical protein
MARSAVLKERVGVMQRNGSAYRPLRRSTAKKTRRTENKSRTTLSWPLIRGAEACRRALISILLKPLGVVVGSTKDAQRARRHPASQSQRAAKRSGTPTTAEPCAALCSLQVYKIPALFWEAFPPQVLVDGNMADSRPRGRRLSQLSTVSLALGL